MEKEIVDFEKIQNEYDEILNQLRNPELISDWGRFEKLTKRKNSLEKIFDLKKEIEENKNQIEENKEIFRANEDPELTSMAETEISQLKEKQIKMEKDLENLIKEKAQTKETFFSENKAAIIEIRAGTGGDEASLFVADLYRMYSRYAQVKGWKLKVLDSHTTELGGYKEMIFEIKDGSVFSEMKYEAGVHRVQRIPLTEKAGRVHTSTCSVAVLPKPKKAQIKIRPEDLKVDVYHSSGHGGQYVNKRMTAVRITHLPTGMVVTCQTERNLLQNKENALALLEARLLEKKESQEMEKISSQRKAQIKWAKRAEKIRTYNFPQDRLTDHRIKKSWHNLEEIMDGKLDDVIESLTKAESEELKEDEKN